MNTTEPTNLFAPPTRSILDAAQRNADYSVSARDGGSDIHIGYDADSSIGWVVGLFDSASKSVFPVRSATQADAQAEADRIMLDLVEQALACTGADVSDL